MIYFIQHQETSLIKIGRTKNITTRQATIARDFGDVELLGLIAGGLTTERQIHSRFRHLRTALLPKTTIGIYKIPKTGAGETEWFTPANELTGFIKASTKLIIPLPFDEPTFVISANERYHPDGRKPTYLDGYKPFIGMPDNVQQMIAEYETKAA